MDASCEKYEMRNNRKEERAPIYTSYPATCSNDAGAFSFGS